MDNQGDKLSELLEGWGETDLQEWLEHPFYQAMEMIVNEQVRRSEEDILRGDISLMSVNKLGLLYRNNDQLRGGVIAMRGLLENLPHTLRDERQLAAENKRDRAQKGEPVNG